MRRPCPLLPLFLLLSGAASLPASTPLSLPGIPDFRLPSAGSVDTVFPAAAGGRRPYAYSVTGLPSGLSFSPATRRARGTLPTVSVDTTYRITYSVRDAAGATASSTFTAVVRPPVRRQPPPPPLSLPGVSNFRLPSAASVDTVFPAATGGRRPYSYSVTGLPSGISFSPSTRRARGTLPTVSADTTYRITYSVRDAAGATDSSAFTTVVTPPAVRRSSPPGPPPRRADPPTVPVEATKLYSVPFTATETGSGETSYRFRLASRTNVSVSLTGMDRDIDCQVGDSSCTNRGSTTNDSWNGTLAAGTHTLKVWPYDGAAGSWTVRVGGTATSPPPPPPPPATPTGGASASRTYLLKLRAQREVSVKLSGMTVDLDCTVAGNRCTNRSGTVDDSWSGTLAAGTHRVVVNPKGSAGGSYTLKVDVKPSSSGTPATTLYFGPPPTAVVSAMGGPGAGGVFCPTDDQGNEDTSACVTINDSITVRARPWLIPPPPQLPPPPPPTGPHLGGGGGGRKEAEPEDELEDACYTSLVESDRVTAVPLQTDRALGSKWGGRNTARKWHRGIDVRAARGDKVFTRVSGDVHRIDPRRHGTNSYNADSGTFGNRYPANGTFVSLVDDLGREHVWVHLQEVSNTNWKSGDRIQAGTVIGKANNSGNSRGDHLHYTIWATVARQKPLDPEVLMSSCNE